MRKIIYAITALLLIVLICYEVVDHKFRNYSETSLKQKTGATNYIIKREVHDNLQSLIEATIPLINKKQLMAKYKFQDFPIKWDGNYISPLVPDNKNYIYYLDDKGHGLYAYVLYCLQKNGDDVIIYECFGD